MLKDNTQQIYRNRDYLPDILEIHRLALLENDLVLVIEVNKSYLKPSIAVAIGQFAEEYKLIMANGVLGGIDCLDDVYNTRHTRNSVEDYPVADNCRQQNWCHVVHIQSIPSA